jgi:uncharacterized protein YggE
MDAVTYMITERLSDENKQKKAALDAAIKYAKQKAEQMADTLGSKVIGFEEIFTDGTNSRRNAADMYDNLSDTFSVCAKRSYAADLQKPKIKISGEVTVVWLTEPLT